jgi:hypothetical protein
LGKIFRAREFTPEMQPQLKPALLRLSAMISQYFMRKPILRFCSPHGNDKDDMNGRDDA